MPETNLLPPDVREEIKRQQGTGDAPGAAGIGGGAKENRRAVPHREAAMGTPPPPPPSEEEAEQEDAIEEATVCPREECSAKLDANWQYCARCGEDLVRGGAAKRLGITFTEEDVTNYLFKGYIVRELKILGNHSLTVKTSQPEDLEDVDDYIMNGDWAKGKDGKEKRISDFFMQNKNQLCSVAVNLVKVDGESIGETLKEKIKYLGSRGSAFVDMITARVILFQRAFTEYLRKKDTILGS